MVLDVHPIRVLNQKKTQSSAIVPDWLLEQICLVSMNCTWQDVREWHMKDSWTHCITIRKEAKVSALRIYPPCLYSVMHHPSPSVVPDFIFKGPTSIRSTVLEGTTVESLDLSDHQHQLRSVEICMDEGYSWACLLVATRVLSTPLVKDLKGIQLNYFVATLISTHGPHLKHFSINRLPISLRTLHKICAGFTNFKQLFTIVKQEDLVSTCPRIWQVPVLKSQIRYRNPLGTHYWKMLNSKLSISILWLSQCMGWVSLLFLPRPHCRSWNIVAPWLHK